MKKILIISNVSSGLLSFRKELIELLAEKNDVTILVSDSDNIEVFEAMGAKCIQIAFNRRGKNPFADLSLLRKYKKIIKEFNPSVVLTYTIKPNVYGGMACRDTKTPYIANVTGLGTAVENGGALAAIAKTLYRIGLKKADCVFFQNSDNMGVFAAEKITTGKTRLIPGSGVNLTKHCREEYPEDDGNIRLLFVGRIMKDKGIDELLSAMRTVHEKHGNVSLDIIGGFDENYSDKIEEAVRDGYIRYHGRQSDVHSFYRNAHCTVLPSYHEGTANVMLESAATCRPVITTRVPGCRETFDEGVTGIGCDAKSAESLADAIEKFIALSYEEKKQMGISGRLKMEREYDRNIVIDAYLEEIERITDK